MRKRAYLYGREVLGPWAGFVAGWGFVIGKTASCAAMALTVASYLAPGDERAVAAAVVVALTVVNCLGVTRTALATKVVVVLVLLAGVGIWFVKPANLNPELWPNAKSVLFGAGVLFIGYEGFGLVTNAAVLTFVNSLGAAAAVVDLDALMVDESAATRILFSVRPTGTFDGGEIMVMNYVSGAGGFLVHGGHVWDTAYDVVANYGSLGMTSEDIASLEAVSSVPEPGTWVLFAGGAAAIAFSRLRRKR